MTDAGHSLPIRVSKSEDIGKLREFRDALEGQSLYGVATPDAPHALILETLEALEKVNASFVCMTVEDRSEGKTAPYILIGELGKLGTPPNPVPSGN